MTADLLYRNVYQLCDGEDIKQLTQQDILNTYKEDPNKGFAYALLKYDGIVYHLANKFYTLDNTDKRSIALEGIFKALETYKTDNKGEANFATHLTHVISNLFSNEIRKNSTQSRTIPDGSKMEYLDSEDDNENSASSVYNRIGINDYRLTDIEILDCVKVLSLTDLEYKYLELVLHDSRVPKTSEICDELGIKRYTLTTFKKNLAKKLNAAINK